MADGGEGGVGWWEECSRLADDEGNGDDWEECDLADEGNTLPGYGGVAADRFARTTMVWEHMARLYPDVTAEPEAWARLRAFVDRSYERASTVYTEASAVEWADGFRIAAETVDADRHLFVSSGFDLERLVRERRAAHGAQRLCKARIEEWIQQDNPERERLLLLADGMTTMLGPPFGGPEEIRPSGPDGWPKMRGKFERVATAVERMLIENFHDRGLALILEADLVKEYIPEALLHASSWAPKPGKAKGRNTSDGNDCGSGTPINSPTVKKRAIERWGPCENPTDTDIDEMISEFLEEMVRNGEDPEDAVLFLIDLDGAFTLLDIHGKEVVNFATELRGGLVLFYLCGLFGWTGTPFCFQVITRACLWELRRIIVGLILMYVDDMFGICRKKDLEANLRRARDFFLGLLGPKAVADAKTQSGRRLVIIGYEFDLDQGLCALSARNLEKTFHVFMSAETHRPLEVRAVQRLASLGSRYGKICRPIQPFVRHLYEAYAGRKQNSSVTLSEEACRTVRLFRALLAFSAISERGFTRRLRFFIPKGQAVRATWDSSLVGIGVTWSIALPDGTRQDIGYTAVCIANFGFDGMPEFQNAAEFMGTIVSIRGAAILGFRDLEIELEGDSQTALTWAETERIRGERGTNAALVFIAQSMVLGIGVSVTLHRIAEENHRSDFLSRLSERGIEVSDRAAIVRTYPELRDVPWVETSSGEVLGLCDPALSFDGDGSFTDHWRRVHHAVATLP